MAFFVQVARGQEVIGKISSLTVSGSQRFTSQQVSPAIGLQPGQAIQKQDLQDAADRLAQTGVFAKVNFRFATEANSIKVEFQVADAPGIPTSFDNFPWFTDEELSQSLRSSVPLFDGQSPEHGTILDDMARSLEKLLETRKVKAQVGHLLSNVPGTDSKVQIFRVEGAGLPVEAIRFSDALASTDRGIAETAKPLIGKQFSREAVELFIFEQVRPVYLSHTRLRVHFGQPQARFSGDPTKPLPNNVVVIVPIEPGPSYSLADVQWTGNTAIPAAELNSLTLMSLGDPADGMKLTAAWLRIGDAYAHRGFLDAKVEPAPKLDDTAARVSYRVAITEGPQYHMGNLILSGLSVEGERRIRAAWNIPAGAVFDRTYFDKFLNQGAREAFGDLPYTYARIDHLLDQHPTTGTVDVLLDFE